MNAAVVPHALARIPKEEKPMRNFILLALTLFILGGCAHSANRYSRSEMGTATSVSSGTVLSVRVVDIEGTNSGVGATTGAVAGGIAGSYIGGDWRANALGAIGGALVGGLVGYAAEEAVTGTTAYEVIVQQDSGQAIAVVQDSDESLTPGERVLILDNGSLRVVRDTNNVGPINTANTGYNPANYNNAYPVQNQQQYNPGYYNQQPSGY